MMGRVRNNDMEESHLMQPNLTINPVHCIMLLSCVIKLTCNLLYLFS